MSAESATPESEVPLLNVGDSRQRQLRDAAVELRTSHSPRSIEAADLAQALARRFSSVERPSSRDIDDAIERALGLIQLAEELAELQRQHRIDEQTVRQRLMVEYPGFSEDSYRAAYAEGLFVTR